MEKFTLTCPSLGFLVNLLQAPAFNPHSFDKHTAHRFSLALGIPPPGLSMKINPSHLNPDMLVDKYIPNLIAKPVDVSHKYAQVIYNQTFSPKLDKVFKKWEEDILTCPGIGFVKMLYSCTTSMASFSVGLLPSIKKSPCVALSCLTRLTRPNPNML